MKNLLLVAHSECLHKYSSLISELSLKYEVKVMEVSAYVDASHFSDIDKAKYEALVLFDSRSLNSTRGSLVESVKQAGIKIISFVSKSATLEDGVSLGENTIIMSHAHVGRNTKIGNNVFLESKVFLGNDVQLENHVTISAFSSVGSFCQLGSNVTVGTGVILQDNIKVGSYSELAIPQVYIQDVHTKSFYHQSFNGSVNIYDFQS